MAGLRVRALAEARGLNISQLQRRADITMGTARRYWYGTRDGREEGEPIEELNIPVLRAIAKVLEVSVYDLIGEDIRPTLRAATPEKRPPRAGLRSAQVGA